MQHADFRRLFGADPHRAEPAILEHRRNCPACAKYADDLESIDRLVDGVPVAPPAAPMPWEVEARRRGVATRWYALAATILLSLLVGFIWTATSHDRTKLVAEILRHAHGERSVLIESPKRVPNPKVEAALAKAGAELVAELPVSIARICKVRGHVAPHLIIQTRDGAVHVMVLSEQRFWKRHRFANEEYTGAFVPQGKHSFAVIGRSQAAVDEATELAKDAIEWPK
jgi:hypothetical protein